MIDFEDHLDLDEHAAVDFVSALRKAWAHTLYPALVAQRDAAAAPADLDAAADEFAGLPLAPWFSHLERQQQKMSWRIMADAVLRRPELARAALDIDPQGAGSLVLDEQLELPDWYTRYDIHLQPGGVWSADASAFIYELGARVVMLRDNDGYKFHNLFTATALPDIEDAECVVDVGCGFGKSTRPLVRRYPTARVVGVDYSAATLKLAHARAEDDGAAIDFVQAPGDQLPLPDASADLVTGTMVLHEMPAEVIASTFHEAARVLKPGGEVRFMEFWMTGDPFFDHTVVGHAERNNEPFFHDLFGTDFVQLCAQAGLEGGTWVPFDERADGLLESGERPKRREWHFPWAVLVARKPETAREEANA